MIKPSGISGHKKTVRAFLTAFIIFLVLFLILQVFDNYHYLNVIVLHTYNVEIMCHRRLLYIYSFLFRLYAFSSFHSFAFAFMKSNTSCHSSFILK